MKNDCHLRFAIGWALVQTQGCPEEGDPFENMTLGVFSTKAAAEEVLQRSYGAGGAGAWIEERTLLTDGTLFVPVEAEPFKDKATE